MKIVIDGCDGTGKTTLCNILAEKYNLDKCHLTNKDPRDYLFYSQIIRKENIIWDRYALSELIYPEIFNRKQELTKKEFEIILKNTKDVKYIILIADIIDLYKRLEIRGEENFIINKIEYINNKFQEYAQIYNIPIINTSKEGYLNEIFKTIG